MPQGKKKKKKSVVLPPAKRTVKRENVVFVLQKTRDFMSLSLTALSLFLSSQRFVFYFTCFSIDPTWQPGCRLC